MRELEVKEGTIRLTEKQFKSLENLCALEGIYQDTGCTDYSMKPPNFCVNAREEVTHRCSECPIGRLRPGFEDHHFCLALLNRFAPGLKRVLHITYTIFFWYERSDKAVRTKFKKLQTKLKDFKKVSR